MNSEQQRAYTAMRAAGESHNIAEMLALQVSPQIGGTDAVFLEGHCNGSQWEGQEHIGDMYKAEAEAAGVNTKGKVYLGGLAEYPGDPRAWVTGRADVKNLCEERGWGCDGAVKVKSADPLRPPTEVRLADDIVDNRVAEIMEHVPEDKRPLVDTQDLKEQVIDKMAPKWK